MAFRTVVLEKTSKISLDLNNIVVNYENEDFWINLDEIATIIIDDPRCLVSLKLLTELCEKGINVILCNSSHMPIGSLNTFFNHSRAPKKLFSQIMWQDEIKLFLWTEIIKRKILSQKETLEFLNFNNKIELINNLYENILFGDSSNREGTVSRIYFKELFGEKFKRFNNDIINYSLNYIYQIIRSKISQEIVSCGYNPCIGINHCSEYNCYSLADDFIEVYRPIVDYYVYQLLFNTEEKYLTPDLKKELVNIINKTIIFNNCKQKIHISIKLYVQCLFAFLETGDIGKLSFPTLK